MPVPLRGERGHHPPWPLCLAAAVWYEALFHDDVTRLEWAPDGLDAKEAVFLRGIAHRTVTEHLRPALPPAGSILTAPPAKAAAGTE